MKRSDVWGASVALPICVAFCSCQSYEAKPLVPIEELANLRQRAKIQGLNEMETSLDGQTGVALVDSSINIADGLSLKEARRWALLRAPDLIIKRAQAAQARALTIDAGKPENPFIFIGPRWSLRGSTAVVPLSLDWTLPLGGVLEAQGELAEAEAQQLEAEVKAAEVQLAAQVTSLYAELAVAEESLRALQLLGSDLGKILEWSTELAKQGVLDELAANLAGLELMDLRNRVYAQELQRDSARAQLLEVLALPPETVLDLSDALEHWEIPFTLDPRASELLESPQIKTAELRYLVAEQQLRLNMAKRWPVIQVGEESEFSQGYEQVGFGFGIHLPIFRRQESPIKAALVGRELHRLQFQQDLNSVLQELEVARANHHRIQAQVAMRKDQESLVLRARESFQRKLKLGQVRLIDLVQVIESINEAELGRLRWLGSRVNARARVLAALGRNQEIPGAESQ